MVPGSHVIFWRFTHVNPIQPNPTQPMGQPNPRSSLDPLFICQEPTTTSCQGFTVSAMVYTAQLSTVPCCLFHFAKCISPTFWSRAEFSNAPRHPRRYCPPRRTGLPHRSPGTFVGLQQPEQGERDIRPQSTSMCPFEPDSRKVTA